MRTINEFIDALVGDNLREQHDYSAYDEWLAIAEGDVPAPSIVQKAAAALIDMHAEIENGGNSSVGRKRKECFSANSLVATD
jgi:hypothetical protein